MSASSPLLLRTALAVALAAAGTPSHAVTITVNDGSDTTSTAVCTLRNAITAINYGNAVRYPACAASLTGPFGDNDTVQFAPALAHSTITLSQGQIANYAPLTVAGSGQTLAAGSGARVLYTIAFLHLSDLVLSGGDAGASPGGGIYAAAASVRLDGVSVSGNRAASGGGLAVIGGSATLVNSTVSSNQANGGQGGAGLFVSNSNVSVSGSSLVDNISTCATACGGGATLVAGSTLALSASTIARNTVAASASAAAGGVFALDSQLSAVNSTFAANGAGGSDALAGAVFERHAAGNATAGVTFTQVTVAGNSATASVPTASAVSGGLLLGSGASGRATLANTILAGNAASRGGSAVATPDLALVAGSFAPSASLLGLGLQPAFDGNANVFADDPRLAPLANFGGTSETRLPLGDSPAIDAGSDPLAVDGAGHALSADQRGAARHVGAHVDIGAVEWPGDVVFRDGFGG